MIFQQLFIFRYISMGYRSATGESQSVSYLYVYMILRIFRWDIGYPIGFMGFAHGFLHLFLGFGDPYNVTTWQHHDNTVQIHRAGHAKVCLLLGTPMEYDGVAWHEMFAAAAAAAVHGKSQGAPEFARISVVFGTEIGWNSSKLRRKREESEIWPFGHTISRHFWLCRATE